MGCVRSTRRQSTKRKKLQINDDVTVQHFNIQRVVGKGGFGKVNAVTLYGENDTWYAMKKLTKETIVEKRSYREVFVERDLLNKLNHPRICNSYFAFQDENYLYLVMDLALGGDLRFQLNHTPSGSPFTEDQVRFYVAQIILAMEYIHGQGVLHRDIKPENLLMDKSGWIKLTDFGIARYLNSKGKCYSSSGTHGYMAPEIYLKTHEHGVESDWFSLGVSAYEMLTKHRPYSTEELRKGPNSANGLRLVPDLENPDSEVRSQQNATLSRACCEFLEATLQTNPRRRLGSVGGVNPRSISWFASSQDFSWETLVKGTINAPFKPDVTKMNADPNVDIQDLFLGGGEKRRLRRLTEEEQKHFVGYEYDFRRKHNKERLSSFESGTSHRLLTSESGAEASSKGDRDDDQLSLDQSEKDPTDVASSEAAQQGACEDTTAKDPVLA